MFVIYLLCCVYVLSCCMLTCCRAVVSMSCRAVLDATALDEKKLDAMRCDDVMPMIVASCSVPLVCNCVVVLCCGVALWMWCVVV